MTKNTPKSLFDCLKARYPQQCKLFVNETKSFACQLKIKGCWFNQLKSFFLEFSFSKEIKMVEFSSCGNMECSLVSILTKNFHLKFSQKNCF